MDALFRIFALIHKEMLAIFKDPRSRLLLFAPPILQSLIFGYAATYDLNDVPYAVFNRDRSAASHELLARLDGSGVFRRVADLDRLSEARRYITERRALLVIQIGEDFERRLLSGLPADVQVIADGRGSNTAGTALGYVNRAVESFNQDRRRERGEPQMPIRVTSRAWYNPNLETRWHMVPALVGTLSLLQTLLLTGMSVAREREQGTFDQLLVTPFRPFEIMVGKAVPPMLVGIGQATLILLVAQLWFRIPFAGAFLTLYIGLIFFLLAAIGIGLLLSAIAATMQQAMLYSFMVMMPFALLSGLTTPIESMPDVLRHLTFLNPLRYAIEMTHRVYLEGAPLNLLLPQIWPLVVIAGLTLPIAAWMFRHRLT
jgi:ABC-2 type transport system permease protein